MPLTSRYRFSDATARRNDKLTCMMINGLSLNLLSLYYNIILHINKSKNVNLSLFRVGPSLNGYQDVTTKHK